MACICGIHGIASLTNLLVSRIVFDFNLSFFVVCGFTCHKACYSKISKKCEGKARGVKSPLDAKPDERKVRVQTEPCISTCELPVMRIPSYIAYVHVHVCITGEGLGVLTQLSLEACCV